MRSSPTRTGCPPCWLPRVPPMCPKNLKPAIRLETSTSKSILMVTTSCPISRVRQKKAPARVSSTSRMMAIWWRCGLTTGSWSLPNNACRDRGDLDGAVRLPSHPENLQPAHRPLRARGYHLQYLLRLGDRPGLFDLCRTKSGGAVPGDLRRNSRRG